MSDKYELKEGSFTLFENDKKTSDNHPDFKGKIKIPADVVPGAEYYIAGWEKQISSGKRLVNGKLDKIVEAKPSDEKINF
jgi:hypothetical protein